VLTESDLSIIMFILPELLRGTSAVEHVDRWEKDISRLRFTSNED